MTALLEKIKAGHDESFYIGVFQDNLEKSTWHYHNSYELCFITEGFGKRIVGDSIQDFQPGDLVFIGRNVPHVWIADKDSGSPRERTLEMVYLQFSNEILAQPLLSLPEFSQVSRAIHLSERGIRIIEETLYKVSEIMLQLPYLKGFERMIGFLRIMDIIGRSDTHIYLATKEYHDMLLRPNDKRIAEINEFLINHYKDTVNLQQLAALVNMAEGSLCRFFKKAMGITIFEYLNQIKIEFAKKLLMDQDLSMTDICFNSGFNNVSHFNSQFRKYTNITPSQYRNRFIKLLY